MIDLHIHSTASDGTLTPSQILTQAIAVGLYAFSITDHDTLNGIQALTAIDIPAQVGFISGIELSTTAPRLWGIAGSLHILGYGIDCHDRELLRTLTTLHESRNQRAAKMIVRLNQLGITISSDDVAKIAGEGVPGRPHVATALIHSGYATDMVDAFERYLGTGRPAYVERYRIKTADAIGLIRRAGGVAVLAHPGVYFGDDPEHMVRVIGELRELGLAGIEAYYPEHSADTINACRRIAKDLGLLITGGTDFHGAIKPGIHMGVGEGAMQVPDVLFDRLLAEVSRLSSAPSL